MKFVLFFAIIEENCDCGKSARGVLETEEGKRVLVAYQLVFVLSFFMLAYLYVGYKNRISISYFMLYGSVLILSLGYMQLAGTDSLHAAISANQLVYLGGCFSPFFLLLCIADLCKMKLSRLLESVMAGCACMLFLLVSTIESTQLYYKDVQLVKEMGISTLQKEYGPLHILYPLFVLFCFGYAISLVLLSYRRKKEVSKVISICLSVIMLFTMLVYLVARMLHANIDWVPFAYIFSLIIITFLLRRISLYDVASITSNSMLESYSHGFFLCDSNGNYLGGNETARMWFPEIRALEVDGKIPIESSPLFVQVEKWLMGQDDKKSVIIEQNGRFIEVSHSLVKEKRRRTIECIYFRDDTKQQQYNKLVQEYNENLERDVHTKTEKIRQMQNDIIISMASIVENRDSNTGGHIARTSDVVKILVRHLKQRGEVLGLTETVAEQIVKAAPLHDFGKIGIPDVILNKPGRFTPDEYEIMKQHSQKGAVIVDRILHNTNDITFKEIAVNVAHFHHEKWDGTGYPDHLKEKEIPFEARVMALADVFDALVSKRVYKESMGYKESFKIIEQSRGTHFDPILCDAFLECRKELEALYNSYPD